MTPLVKASLLSLTAVCATYAISLTSRLLTQSTIDPLTLINSAIIPVIITLPISLIVFRQGEKLRRAYAALEDAHRLLSDRASHDSLTGLLNRESFLAPVEMTRRLSDRGVLLVVDADHFKSINDNCGHAAGDAALKAIAGALSGAVRANDLVGRLGGEEFGIFLRGADLAEARQIAERVRHAVEAVEFSSELCGPVTLTVSVGGTQCLTDAATVEALQAADLCLYEAKRGGRNRVVIGPQFAMAAVA